MKAAAKDPKNGSPKHMKKIEREISLEFSRASGPGGQNVNKVSTAVKLRFDVTHSPSLAEDVKARLIHIAAGKITANGNLLIEARRYRTQKQNRADAIQRFYDLVRKAQMKPRIRRKTKPTTASMEARIKTKKIRGAIKKFRSNRLED